MKAQKKALSGKHNSRKSAAVSKQAKGRQSTAPSFADLTLNGEPIEITETLWRAFAQMCKQRGLNPANEASRVITAAVMTDVARVKASLARPLPEWAEEQTEKMPKGSVVKALQIDLKDIARLSGLSVENVATLLSVLRIYEFEVSTNDRQILVRVPRALVDIARAKAESEAKRQSEKGGAR